MASETKKKRREDEADAEAKTTTAEEKPRADVEGGRAAGRSATGHAR